LIVKRFAVPLSKDFSYGSVENSAAAAYGKSGHAFWKWYVIVFPEQEAAASKCACASAVPVSGPTYLVDRS
jgi:hypothetical protein